jgi:hypothetical protein
MTKRTPPYSMGSEPVRCGWFWDHQGEHASQWADLMTALGAERTQMIAHGAGPSIKVRRFVNSLELPFCSSIGRVYSGRSPDETVLERSAVRFPLRSTTHSPGNASSIPVGEDGLISGT